MFFIRKDLLKKISVKKITKDDSEASFGLVKTNKNGSTETTEKISDIPLNIIVIINKIN